MSETITITLTLDQAARMRSSVEIALKTCQSVRDRGEHDPAVIADLEQMITDQGELLELLRPRVVKPIREGNYPRYYYPEKLMGPRWLDPNRRPTDNPAEINLFVHPGDATRWAERAGWGKYMTVKSFDLPFVIEYEDGVWQKARRYVDLDTALEAWPGMVDQAKKSALNNRVWRLTSELTGEVLKVWDGAHER